MSYGISCWPYGESDPYRGCSRTIEDRPLEGHESFMQRAGREGWCIGHYDGQAYYVCPEHKHAVWDAIPLAGLFTRKPFARNRDRPPFKRLIARRTVGHRMTQYRHTTLDGFRFLNARFRMTWAQRRHHDQTA